MDDLDEVLGNAIVVFGLEAQGHIPTIERMLAEGSNWEQIGKVIGWCHITAREQYEKYTRRDQTIRTVWFEEENEVCPLLARAVEMLRKVGNNLEHSWERNPISEFIFHAEKHLNSTSTKRHPILKPTTEQVERLNLDENANISNL